MSRSTKVGLKVNEFVIIPTDWKERFKAVAGKEAKGTWIVSYNYIASKGLPVVAQELIDIEADHRRQRPGYGSRGGKPGSELPFAKQSIGWFVNRGVFTVVRPVTA
jgi:hypothetical protein